MTRAGQYLPGDGPIHRLDPRVKILWAIVLSLLLFRAGLAGGLDGAVRADAGHAAARLALLDPDHGPPQPLQHLAHEPHQGHLDLGRHHSHRAHSRTTGS